MTELPINQIIQGDCLEIMKGMADKSVDLVLTDPPYGIDVLKATYQNKKTKPGNALAHKTNYEDASWDKTTPSKELFNEIFRVSKKQIIFGGNYFNLPPSPCWLVWDKENGDNDFADCELVWTSFNSAVRKIKYRWAGMLQGDMKNKEIRQHPTQKPVPVMRWILEKYSEPNQTILDPFAGSGTTCVAAKMEGRNYIGIEISEKYCKIAEQRVASTTTPLFI